MKMYNSEMHGADSSELKSKSKFFCIHAMKVYVWGGGAAPLVFNLGTRYKRVVSLMPGKEAPVHTE